MEATLLPGTILHLHCDFTQPPKEKFLLFVCDEPKPLFLLINSRIHPFHARKPDLANCQVMIDAQSHGFLAHDSYIDCTEACTIVDFRWQVRKDPSRVKCRASADVIAAVRVAVGNSPLMPDNQKQWLLAVLN